jgi:hypothetical protein
VSQHFTKNTIAASAWCNHCGRTTLHVVSGNRIGRCAEHDAPQLSKAQLQRRRRANQGALFQEPLP